MLKRVLMSLILLSLVLIMGSTVHAGDGDLPITISITPFSGEAGTVVSVTGTTTEPTVMVFVTLSPQPNSSLDALATVEVAPESDGTFSTSLTVPADLTDGVYYVRAGQFIGTSEYYYYNTFRVGSGVDAALLPTTGNILGTPVTLTGAIGFLLVLALAAGGTIRVINRRPNPAETPDA